MVLVAAALVIGLFVFEVRILSGEESAKPEPEPWNRPDEPNRGMLHRDRDARSGGASAAELKGVTDTLSSMEQQIVNSVTQSRQPFWSQRFGESARVVGGGSESTSSRSWVTAPHILR